MRTSTCLLTCSNVSPASGPHGLPEERPMVVILCGGRGTRLQEHTQAIPKPLVEIGGRPILWHVIQIYLAQRFTRFVLLTGYKAGLIESFSRETAWPSGTEVT